MQNLRAERDPSETLVHFTSEEGNFSDFLRGPNPQALCYQPTGTRRPSTCHLELAVCGHGRIVASLETEGPVGGGEGLSPLLAQLPISSTPQIPLS